MSDGRRKAGETIADKPAMIEGLRGGLANLRLIAPEKRTEEDATSIEFIVDLFARHNIKETA